MTNRKAKWPVNTALILPFLLMILFLLPGCNTGKALSYRAPDSTAAGMCRYSIHVRHLPMDRMDQLVSDFSEDISYCQVQQINQVQSAFLFPTAQNNVAITLWATPASMKAFTRLLMDSGGLVEVVRVQ